MNFSEYYKDKLMKAYTILAHLIFRLFFYSLMVP